MWKVRVVLWRNFYGQISQPNFNSSVCRLSWVSTPSFLLVLNSQNLHLKSFSLQVVWWLSRFSKSTNLFQQDLHLKFVFISALIWHFMWLFKSPCLRYFLEQVGHPKYFFSSLVCFKAMWVVRFVSVDKPFPQIPQMKNLSISILFECLDLICRRTLFSFLKVFVHCVQGTLSALWTCRWWRLKLIEFLKDFPQELHSRGVHWCVAPYDFLISVCLRLLDRACIGIASPPPYVFWNGKWGLLYDWTSSRKDHI